MPDVARTLDLPSGQRFEYWKHILSHTFAPLEVSQAACAGVQDGRWPAA
jgi:hypothetical protein